METWELIIFYNPLDSLSSFSSSSSSDLPSLWRRVSDVYDDVSNEVVDEAVDEVVDKVVDDKGGGECGRLVSDFVSALLL